MICLCTGKIILRVAGTIFVFYVDLRQLSESQMSCSKPGCGSQEPISTAMRFYSYIGIRNQRFCQSENIQKNKITFRSNTVQHFPRACNIPCPCAAHSFFKQTSMELVVASDGLENMLGVFCWGPLKCEANWFGFEMSWICRAKFKCFVALSPAYPFPASHLSSALQNWFLFSLWAFACFYNISSYNIDECI